jgi:hypothetical protein
MKRKLSQSNAPQTSNKQAKTSTPPPTTVTPLAKQTLKFGHSDFAPHQMESGSGLKWHDLSNISFKGGMGPSSAFETYRKETGLEPLKTNQNWSDTGSKLPDGTMYRSRRGSLSGFVEMPGGEVKGWRMHSLPTTEALRETSVKNSTDFSNAFETQAKRLSTHAVNTKGTKQTVNTILSDVTKIRHDSGSDRFVASEPTHAMGVSGQGLATSHDHTERRELYKPSIDVAVKDGKKGTPEQTYHSEPMAMTLHNQHRSTETQQDTGLVGMFASFPNQVCFNCGRMFEANIGDKAVFSGSPGVPFGGQKPGDKFVQGTGSTVFRATPMTELSGDTSHGTELSKLYEHHHH